MKKRSQKPTKQRSADDDESRREFLAAVGAISDEDIALHKPPDLEAELHLASTQPGQPRDDRIVDTLDLHGMTKDQATERLINALGHLQPNGGSVIIIVGKGNHNPDGVGILRKSIPRWLETDGLKYVAGWEWAPRRHGGRGAIVARLRTVDP